jgi:hypothetical protein
MTTPTSCHLWRIDAMLEKDLRTALDSVETLADESHLTKTLYRCKTCGQLYVDIWYELIDWNDGDDQSYELYVPVAGQPEIDRLKTLTPPPMSLDLLAIVPRLQSDAGGADRQVRWVRTES